MIRAKTVISGERGEGKSYRLGALIRQAVANESVLIVPNELRVAQWQRDLCYALPRFERSSSCLVTQGKHIRGLNVTNVFVDDADQIPDEELLEVSHLLRWTTWVETRTKRF